MRGITTVLTALAIPAAATDGKVPCTLAFIVHSVCAVIVLALRCQQAERQANPHWIFSGCYATFSDTRSRRLMPGHVMLEGLFGL